MAIITISRGTFSGGQTLAECIAQKLGYRCISREVLVAAARDYGVPLEKLSRALAEPPGFLERLTMERVHYLAYIRSTLCKEVKDDKVVYVGLAGHLLLRGLPHVLRVRVVASMEFRIKGAMERRHLNREQAIQFIRDVDDKRGKWTRFLYHVDWGDPSLYDLVINLDRIGFSSACEMVRCAVRQHEFATTLEAKKMMEDMILASEARAAIAADEGVADAGVEVEADGGVVTLRGTVGSLADADRIRETVRKMQGVRDVNSQMQVRRYW